MRARLTVVAGVADPLVCDLAPDQIVRLGRKANNTVVVRDDHASRLHAELFAGEGGRWLLRDCETTNGTRLNGRKIDRPTPLDDGAVIGIGEARLLFNLAPTAAAAPTPPVVGDLDQTRFQADELTALFTFLNEALRADGTHGLISLALHTARRQLMAGVCGFLALDGDGPPRVVVPEASEIDVPLSRCLTQQAQAAGRTAWLEGPGSPRLDTESLDAFRDAVCVLVPGGAGEPPLGALHVYKSGQPFRDREVRFLEVLASCLSGGLLQLRGRRALEAENEQLRELAPDAGDRLIGDSTAMRRVRREIERLGPTPCGVLIIGESGVGKELVARAIHRHSARRDGPLVCVNCAAIPGELFESELFGHKKGGFTGADRDRPGRFRMADQGTLFLDEIGELVVENQVKLLRVLEDLSFYPVGDDKPVTVDVRVLAATNRDLEQMVAEGKFRPELLYRLGLPLEVPPLRERAEDVPALAQHLLALEGARFGRRATLSAAALERLREHPWPGNIRELRRVLEHALALGGEVIAASDLRLRGQATPGAERVDGPPSLRLEEVEKWAIRQALAQTGNNKTHAAKVLDIGRDTLIRKVKEYGLE
jgi:Nif-specific regulatory protein